MVTITRPQPLPTTKSEAGTKKQFSRVVPFKYERELCSLFISEFSLMPGWRCYPETAGFDVLAVHDDGRQIGVEAKLTLNAKVAEQVLPSRHFEFSGAPGPDYRMVIVPRITTSNAGIARMLDMLGVVVVAPRPESAGSSVFSFGNFHGVLEARGQPASFSDQYMYDWNPEVRCAIPSLMPNVPAGVPAPVRLTPWKEAALRVIALLRSQGFVTAQQIASHGISPATWTRGATDFPSWLTKGDVQGQWVETCNLPKFDLQHPELFRGLLIDKSVGQADRL